MVVVMRKDGVQQTLKLSFLGALASVPQLFGVSSHMMKGLRVQFLARVHTEVANLMPGQERIWKATN